MLIKRIVTIFSLWVLAVTAAFAQFDHSHAQWNALLKKHVVVLEAGKASQLRYAGMSTDRAQLKTYLDTLAAVSEADFKSWNKNQQLAFLINAYNANMVEKILLRYPNIKSAWDFGKLIGNPFKDNFINLFGRKMTLDNIEHDTIRAPGSYDDPRIHFAVNCASIGCPMLREEAFVGERVDAQLEEQTVRFMSDRSRNRYNADKNTLEVSKIFLWYKTDWTSGYRGIGGSAQAVTTTGQFLARYARFLADQPAHQQQIAAGRATISYLEYDWTLNNFKP